MNFFKNILPLIKVELKSYQDAKVRYIFEKRILKQLSKSKNIGKLQFIATKKINIEAQRIVFVI